LRSRSCSSAPPRPGTAWTKHLWARRRRVGRPVRLQEILSGFDSRTLPAAKSTRASRAERAVGVDSYAYHRLLGEVRSGEAPPAHAFPRRSLDVVAHARALDLDAVMLETSLLGPPGAFAPEPYLAEAGEVALGLSWGAPSGFAFGDRPEAMDDLVAWLVHAAVLGLPLMRIVAGGPAHRGRSTAALVPILKTACAAASASGLALALENHADLTVDELERLLDAVGDERLRVCFDTANALRVGDDVLEAAQRLAPAIDVIHVKDCAPDWDDPVAGPLSVAPGEGVIPLDGVLAVCPDALACVELGQLRPDADELTLVAATVEYIRAR
jgi:sugar phosphate isomerase/epimerase